MEATPEQVAWTRGYDAGKEEATRTLGINDAICIGGIIGAAQRGAKVARLVGDEVIEGTARSIGDLDGAFLAPGEDVRDGWLRVTNTMGWDHYWLVSDLIGDYQATTFVVDYGG